MMWFAIVIIVLLILLEVETQMEYYWEYKKKELSAKHNIKAGEKQL